VPEYPKNMSQVLRTAVTTLTPKYYACVLITIALIVILLAIKDVKYDLESIDFNQPWIAGKVLLQGENPYLWDNLSAENELQNFNVENNYFFHTPNIFFLLIPFSLLSYELAISAIMLANLGAIAGIVYVFFLLFAKKQSESQFLNIHLFMLMIFLFIMGTSSSIEFNLRAGNRSILTGFMFLLSSYLLLSSNRTVLFWGGFCLSLTAFKPNLFLFCYFIFFLKIFAGKDLLTLSGFFIGALLTVLVPSLFRPELLWNFLTADLSSAGHYKTPTLGAVASIISQNYSIYIKLLPVTLLCLLSLSSASIRRIVFNLPMGVALLCCLPISVLFAPYAWSYDFLLFYIACAVFIITLKTRKQIRPALPCLILIAAAETFVRSQSGDEFNRLWFSVFFCAFFYTTLTFTYSPDSQAGRPLRAVS